MNMPTSKKILLGAINKDLAARLLKEKGRELVGAVRDALPADYEYLVVLKQGGSLAFFTDSSREDAVRMLREVLDELGGPCTSSS